MELRYKRRAVNLGFGLGVVLIASSLLVIWFASAAWSGWATFLVAVGVLAALVGFVFALIPARGQR